MLFLPGAARGAEPAPAGAVALSGAVARPGDYPIRPGERLSSLVERAGGYSDNALLFAAVLTRPSQVETQRAALREAVGRAEARALASGGEQERKRLYFGPLKELAPNGRVPVRLAHPRLLKGSDSDLALQAGDRLEIPSGSPGVAVTGAVMAPEPPIHPYAPGAGYLEFIRAAGGFAPDADRERPLLLKADGSVVPLFRGAVRWNEGKKRWEISAFSDDRPRVEPGDRIAVPRRPSAGSWLRAPGDLDALREQIAALTGVVVDPP